MAGRCDPGDSRLGAVERAVAAHDLRDTTVAAGVGTLSTLRVSSLEGSDRSRPRSERDVVVAEDGDWELTSLTGVVAVGEPRVHVAAHEADRALGGHLLPGSEVKALAEVVLSATPPALRREADGDDVRRPTDR